MKLNYARDLAERTVAELRPWCERIEIAGSIRREKPEPGDIEIVCIPKKKNDLFGAGVEPVDEFCWQVEKWEKAKGSPGGKYTQRLLPGGATLDLFIARPENWGLILAIRTGSAGFSHLVLAARWREAGFECNAGMLWQNDKLVEVREEEKLFELLGLKWIEPKERSLV